MFLISRNFTLWEKVMRKLLVLLMIGVLSLCAFGCKKKPAEEEKKPPAEAEEPAEETKTDE